MNESGPKKGKSRIEASGIEDSSLIRQRMREAHEAALEATRRELAGEDIQDKLALEYQAFAFRFNSPNKDGKRIVSKNQPWGEDDKIADWLLSKFPHGLPTPKRLQYGDDDERALYGALHRRQMHNYLPRFKPYGDPKEYYEKRYLGKTIGQVDALDPNFVLYCRYHKITGIMPKVNRNPWKGREEEAFKEKYGDMDPGKVSTLGPEGHRDYMRLYRSRKKQSE